MTTHSRLPALGFAAAAALLAAACGSAPNPPPPGTGSPVMAAQSAPSSPPATASAELSVTTTALPASPVATVAAASPASQPATATTRPATDVPDTPTPIPATPKPAYPMSVTIGVPPGTTIWSPSNVTIAVGGTVTWTWSGDTFHDLVGLNFEPGFSTKYHDTPQKSANISFTFTAPGTYHYECSVHTNSRTSMTGEVIVK